MRNIFAAQAALFALGMEYSRMMTQAQMVIALRMMGMGGMWNLGPGEENRMVAEKQKAFTQAGFDMWKAALRGGGADAVLRAGVRSLDRATGANVRRLGRRGPSLPGGRRRK
ncbi:MAG: antifreeze protein [Paracoccus sp. (in: a-proteobacteria)]|nr:antifreeze protein [Paracoccus sp. (in: a-proteobacteria)]